MRPSRKARPKPPIEYSILYTATLCLIAAGAVMVYSSSSAESLLQGTGDPSYFLKRYLIYAAIGLLVMHLLSRRGLKVIRDVTPVLLIGSFGLCIAAMLPGIGVTVNGATRWIGAGPVQFQPSELLKVALVLYGAQLLAARPNRILTLGGLCKPFLIEVGAGCLVLLKQPDMGTALVICFATVCLLLASGARLRHLGIIVGSLAAVVAILAVIEPYRLARLTSFVDPWADASGDGFQSVQAMIARGSGGCFGRGLGESVQKIFYLPEAHTDMILAVVGEELGVLGVSALAALYGMIGYAGFRAAKSARDSYAKLLAAGVTSLILAQAVLNFFAVMGLAPLTGVPLPFVSYGNSNLIVLLGAMGLLLCVAARRGQAQAAGRERGGKRELRSIDGGRSADEREAARADRRRRHGGTRRAGARDSRRATR
ncbi:MAG: cell division protein FtsW [Solirubrobacteraceae bacterium]|nr:cell division protein FtsW [Solirubrobacteraceae bacterium]